MSTGDDSDPVEWPPSGTARHAWLPTLIGQTTEHGPCIRMLQGRFGQIPSPCLDGPPISGFKQHGTKQRLRLCLIRSAGDNLPQQLFGQRVIPLADGRLGESRQWKGVFGHGLPAFPQDRRGDLVHHRIRTTDPDEMFDRTVQPFQSLHHKRPRLPCAPFDGKQVAEPEIGLGMIRITPQRLSEEFSASLARPFCRSSSPAATSASVPS